MQQVIILILAITLAVVLLIPYLKKRRERATHSEEEIQNKRIDLSWQANIILGKYDYNDMIRKQDRLISKYKDDLYDTLLVNHEISAGKIHQLFLAFDSNHASNGYISPLLIQALEKAIVEYLTINPAEKKLQNVAVIYTDSDSLGFEYKFIVKAIDRIMDENQFVAQYNELFKELVEQEIKIKKRAEG